MGEKKKRIKMKYYCWFWSLGWSMNVITYLLYLYSTLKYFYYSFEKKKETEEGLENGEKETMKKGTIE